MSKVSENLKFLTISAFECENPESLGISGFFTLHVASLGTALPDEFGSFPLILLFLCLTTRSIFVPEPTQPYC